MTPPVRLAVLGDIHGNIEALRAAYEAALAKGPDEIIHLGDLGGYAPFVNEVVDFLVEKEIRGVQGNYDYNVAADSEHCGCRYDDPEAARLADLSFRWTKKHASEHSKAYMRGLPHEIRMDAGGRSLCLFHATPHKNNLYWFEDRPDKFFLEMAEKAQADVMVYGHTHLPYRKDIDGMAFINAGSTGRPKDGDPGACVTMVEIRDKRVESMLLRVPYDVENTARAIGESGLPAEFAAMLREAR